MPDNFGEHIDNGNQDQDASCSACQNRLLNPPAPRQGDGSDYDNHKQQYDKWPEQFRRSCPGVSKVLTFHDRRAYHSGLAM